MEIWESYYFGIKITIIAYVIWYVVRPLSIFINKKLEEFGRIICLILSHILRFLIIIIIYLGSAYGFIFIIQGLFSSTPMSYHILNGLILFIGLGALGMVVNKYYLNKPFKCTKPSIPNIDDSKTKDSDDIID